MILQELLFKEEDFNPKVKLHTKVQLDDYYEDEPSSSKDYAIYSIEGLSEKQKKRIFDVVNKRYRKVEPGIYRAYRDAGLMVDRVFGDNLSSLRSSKVPSYNGKGKLFFSVALSDKENVNSKEDDDKRQKYAENYVKHLVGYVTAPLAASAKSTPSKYEIRKYQGDDLYSWALFKKGDSRPLYTGMSKNEATWRKNEMEKGK